MQKIIRAAVVPMVLLPLIIGMAGCTGGDRFTEEELRELVDRAADTTASSRTLSFSQDMEMTANITADEESGAISMTGSGNGVSDWVAENSLINMVMSISVESQGMEFSMDDIAIEMYVVDGWVYYHISIAEIDDRWLKARPDEDTSAMLFDQDTIDQSLALLDTPEAVEYLRDEPVSGADCYVVAVTPSQAPYQEWLETQGLPLDLFDDVNLEQLMMEFVSGVSYTVWIDKRDDYIRRMDTAFTFDLTGTMLGEHADGLDAMLMTVSSSMVLDNFNEPVEIVLPEEAKDAEESTEMGFPFM